MRIAVDALGGDNAPNEIVAGAIAAAKKLPNDKILLIGDEDAVEAPLRGTPGNVSVYHARGSIEMNEDPAAALRSRPDSSIAVSAALVRAGEADAFFSAGSTGASVAAALLKIGRIRGCRRPAIATPLPFDNPVLLLDVGATVSCRPRDLLNFAILGSVFTSKYLDTAGAPRVGLINVGEEPGKGSDLAKEAFKLLAASNCVRFVGNVEGREIGRGSADVIVTDGFTGNVILKTAEGVTLEVFGMLRRVITSSPITKLAGFVLRPRLLGIRERLDPESYGGSFLLGVRSPVIIGHGNSRARGVENAIVGISRAGSGLVEESEKALVAAGSGV